MQSEGNAVDKTRVFVVHGRNEELRKSLFEFLRSIGLKPIEWSQAIQMTGETVPFIGDILDAAFQQAQAVVVLLNGDDEARLRPEYHSDKMPEYEKNLTPQARPNVLFEAGLALGRFPKRTIIVEVGELRPFSDIAGRHTIRLDNSTRTRQDVAQRLAIAGCKVDLSGTDWHQSGDFEISSSLPSEILGTNLDIPPKTYSQLIGRQEEIVQIMGTLREPKSKPAIAIVGLGGIGKTALAREIAERLHEEKSFHRIIWANFKTEYFVSEHITRSEGSNYTFDELLNDILRKCTRANITQMSSDQKRIKVQELLKNDKERALIVLDNLDTAPERENLVAKVFEILGQGKLLITSRHYLKHERVYTINLYGFSVDEGVAFLMEESRERGIETLTKASHSSLVEIRHVTGGAPLAMKLIIGQMSRQPMDVVLNALKEASPKGQDYELYRFIYQYSWEILNMNARMILVDMSVFPPITGGTIKHVEAISQVEAPDFWLAMDQLVALSLVDKIGGAGKERFALHPLTQYFIRSDITKEWAE